MMWFIKFVILFCSSTLAFGLGQRNHSNPQLPKKNKNTAVSKPSNWRHPGFLRDPEEILFDTFKIGALFDQPDSLEEIALKLAVERFNKRNAEAGLRFKAHIDYAAEGSYFVDKQACELLQEGVATIFGPQTNHIASHVQSICDAFEIPHIETKWDYDIRGEHYLINLAPHPDTLSHAYSDLVRDLNWEQYLLLYEGDDGLFRLQGVIQLSIPPDRKAMVKKLPEGDDFRPLLYGILDGDTYTHFIIDCSPPTAYLFLTQSQQIGFLDAKVHIIFTTLDISILNLDNFRHSRATILAYRLVNPEREEVKEVISSWQEYSASGGESGADSQSDLPKMSQVSSRLSLDPNLPQFYERYDIEHLGPKSRYRPRRNRRSEDGGSSGEGSSAWAGVNGGIPEWFTTEVALTFDAVDLLGQALDALGSIQEVEIPPLHCQSSKSWPQGYSVINIMKTGLTGWIQFNTTGFRMDIGLEIVQLKETGLEKVGAWDAKFVNKIMWDNRRPNEVLAVAPDEDIVGKPTLKGKHLIVTTIMGAPMAMWKISETPLTDNDRFEGYAVDIVKHFAEMYDFTFTIKPVGDGKYGGQNAKGEWNGMVREVMDGVADIAVADLTVNKQRAAAIDLTMPFMTLGISILFVAPTKKSPSLLSFMAPMDWEVWMYVCLAIAGTTMTLFMCARVSPFEWIVPHPCIDDPDELENEFTLRDSFFFVLGTYLCQGAAIAPKTASTRMVAGFWWLFTLIMVSSYTANLATFLIVADMDIIIRSLDDLPKQDKVKYGCLGGGTTGTFFRTSPFPVHRAVWKNMMAMTKAGDPVFQTSNRAGVERVVRDAGKYAFFMESTGIEYNVERNCKLDQVGGLLDNKGYAIGLKKGSNYTQLLSSAILKFQEKGILDELKRKWWKDERKDNACDDDEEEGGGGVEALTLANVGGIFVVLVVGCFLSIFVSCYELITSARDLSAESNDSFCTELINELKFAFTCKGSTKPVRKSPEDEDGGQDEECGSEKSNKSICSSKGTSKKGSKAGSDKASDKASDKRSSAESERSSAKETCVTGALHISYKSAKEQ